MLDAIELKGEVWRLSGQDDLMIHVHKRGDCMGTTCTLHKPTGNHMREWPLSWSRSKRAFFRKCPHGHEHPDIDGRVYWPGHACDGCCAVPVAGSLTCVEQNCGNLIDKGGTGLFCSNHTRDAWGVRQIDCQCWWGNRDNKRPKVCDAHGLALSRVMHARQSSGEWNQ